jgi:hypothetical protein
MKLYEFFSKPETQVAERQKQDFNDMARENKQSLSDAIYWDILDDDYLHKKYFLPLARKIKLAQKQKKVNKYDFTDMWMPMVNHGCKQFYKNKEIKGDPAEIFDKKFRVELCKRLAEKFYQDIDKNEYKLGTEN